MACCHYYAITEGHESAFAVDASMITIGPGVLKEIGGHALALGIKRAALFTDKRVGRLPCVADAVHSLRGAGVDFVVYDECKVEPTDLSFLAAARFAREGKFDGYVSIGGGSAMDTCKAANLYATWPAEFLDYVNAPIGAATLSRGRSSPTSPAQRPAEPVLRTPVSRSSICCPCGSRQRSRQRVCVPPARWWTRPPLTHCRRMWSRQAGSMCYAMRSSRTRRGPIQCANGCM